jgi:hypothetical protein
MINGRGGLHDPDSGILIETVTKNEQQMLPFTFSFSGTVTAPDTPSGATNGLTGTIYTYLTGGAISDTGDPLQYLLDWGDGSNSGWLPVGQLSASKSWSSIGTYMVRAQARCANDTLVLSPWSGTLSVTITQQTAPSPPTNVQASDGAYVDKVKVTWAASSGATSYTVHRSTSRRGTKVAIGTTSGTSYDDTTASAGRTYYYWVTGTNVYGASGFSAYDTGYR